MRCFLVVAKILVNIDHAEGSHNNSAQVTMVFDKE